MTRLEKIDTFLKSYPIFGEGFVKYSVEGGNVYGTSIMNNKDIAVQTLPMKAGQCFEPHTHKTREWLILYYGEALFVIDGKERYAKAGDFLFIEPNVLHSLKALTDLKVLAVTVPADDCFPKDNQKGQ